MQNNIKLEIENIREKHEFLTVLLMANDVIRVGIVQNENMKMITFYDFGKLKTENEKKIFLKFGDEWWWGSNQSIPIDSFIGDDFGLFNYILIGYPKKSVLEFHGPTFSLRERYIKRIKEKRIEIINTR